MNDRIHTERAIAHPDDNPDSNLTSWFAALNSSQSSAATVIGTTLGMLADVGGAIGTIGLLVNLIDPPPDVATELQSDFASMSSMLEMISTQIANLELETRRNAIDQVVAPALAIQESFADLVAADDLAQWQHAIDDCITAVAYFAEADPWMIDAPCLPPFNIPWCGPVGQTATADGLVFCTLYILPQYLLVLQILLTVLAAVPDGYTEHQALLSAHRDNLRQLHDRVVAGLTIIREPAKWVDMVQQSPIHPRGPWLMVNPAGAGMQPEAPFGAVDVSSRTNNVGSYLLMPNTVEVPIEAALGGYLRDLRIRAIQRQKSLYIDAGLPTVRSMLKSLIALTGGPTSQVSIYERWLSSDVFGFLAIAADDPARYETARQGTEGVPPHGGVFEFAGEPPPQLVAAPLAVDVLGELVAEAEQLHVAISVGGIAYHTVCTSDMRPQAQGVSQVTALSAAPQPAQSIATAFTDGSLHVFQGSAGLWHTVRYPDGSWQHSPVNLAATVSAGEFPAGPFAACGINDTDVIHLLAVDGGTNLLRADRAVYMPPPLVLTPFGSTWVSEEPVSVIDATVTSDDASVHVVALDEAGRGWHTVSTAGSQPQAMFGDLGGVQGWPGSMSAITCAASGMVLHVLGVFQGHLWHALRAPDGSWPFGWSQVVAQGGPPGVGPFSAVGATGTPAGVIAVGASGELLWRARVGIDGVWWGYDKVGSAPAAITALSCANAQDSL